MAHHADPSRYGEPHHNQHCIRHLQETLAQGAKVALITLIVPGVEATFTVSVVFAFTSVLPFGPEAGAVTLALDCLVLAWHRRMGLDKAAFNFCHLAAASASLALLLAVALQQVRSAAISLPPPVLLVFLPHAAIVVDAKGHLETLNTLYLSTVETLAIAIDAKDEVTHGHIRRVQLAAMSLARELGVKDTDTLNAIGCPAAPRYRQDRSRRALSIVR